MSEETQKKISITNLDWKKYPVENKKFITTIVFTDENPLLISLLSYIAKLYPEKTTKIYNKYSYTDKDILSIKHDFLHNDYHYIFYGKNGTIPNICYTSSDIIIFDNKENINKYLRTRHNCSMDGFNLDNFFPVVDKRDYELVFNIIDKREVSVYKDDATIVYTNINPNVSILPLIDSFKNTMSYREVYIGPDTLDLKTQKYSHIDKIYTDNLTRENVIDTIKQHIYTPYFLYLENGWVFTPENTFEFINQAIITLNHSKNNQVVLNKYFSTTKKQAEERSGSPLIELVHTNNKVLVHKYISTEEQKRLNISYNNTHHIKSSDDSLALFPSLYRCKKEESDNGDIVYLNNFNIENKMKEQYCSFVSSRGICNICDIFPDFKEGDRYTSYISNLYNKKNIIYIPFNYLPIFTSNILSSITPHKQQLPNFSLSLIIGSDDATFPNDFINNNVYESLISNPLVDKIYSQNCLIENEKVIPIPIGLDYHTISFKNTWGENISSPLVQENVLNNTINSSFPLRQCELKCATNFHHGIPGILREKRRGPIFNTLKDKDWMVWLPNQPRTDSWIETSKYSFVLAPSGNGYDTHRLWEGLALGKIVLVDTYLPVYKDLPVFEVKDWNNIDIEWLRRKKEEVLNNYSTYKWEKLTLKYWKDIIRSD